MEETESDLWPAVLHTGLGFSGVHHRYGLLKAGYDKEMLVLLLSPADELILCHEMLLKMSSKCFNLTLINV